MSKVAIILIRGLVGVRAPIKDTLRMLGFEKKHVCVIRDDSPSLQGMLKKVNDMVTFGPVSDEVVSLLEEKRSKTSSSDEKKSIYFLAPPIGGFERKGIKKSFVIGGALGDRGEAINDLIKKMI